ncbi:MAG TPA: SGNH/GDSL hydrolase family protein [Candidatus Krumholzibacteria bacterium]|nr:SGNH/GDSL hydrolase family protein [Candidatus Krumholzibacteria bacterium]
MTRSFPSHFKQILASTGAVVLVLCAMEIVLRFFIASPSTTEPDPQFEYFQRPYSYQVFSSEGYSRARANRFGLNDDDPLPRKPPLRALLIGDSYTEAMQVYPSQNFGSVAQSLVKGLEVCNAGHSGWGPPDLIAFAELRGPQFHPDVVVIQLNDLDLQEFFKQGNVHLKAEGDSWKMVVPTLVADTSTSHQLLRSALQHSALLTLMGRRGEALIHEEKARLSRHFLTRPASASNGPEGDPSEDPDAVDSTGVPYRAVDMLCYLHEELSAHYPDPIYVYIPHISYLDGTDDMPRRRAIYHEFAARCGATLIDPTDALLAEFRLHGQPCHGFQNSKMGKGHLNPRGHRVVGKLLAAELRKRLP